MAGRTEAQRTEAQRTEATADVTTVGPGGLWRVLTAVIFGCIAFLGVLMLAVIGLDWPPTSVGLAAVRAGLGVGLIGVAVVVRRFMRRSGPALRLAPEGVSGPGLPGVLPWDGVAGVELRSVRIGRASQVVAEIVLADSTRERYLAALSPARRALLRADALAGRPLVGVTVTALERTPDEVAALIGTYAQRYG